MRSLQEQFDDCIADVYAEDKRQRAILMRFMSEYYKEEDLIDYVMEQMADGEFRMGDDAKTFFCRCADDLFRKRLELLRGKKLEGNIRDRHPLFGAPWWTT